MRPISDSNSGSFTVDARKCGVVITCVIPCSHISSNADNDCSSDSDPSSTPGMIWL
jgi:hypothetical protein